MYDKYRKASDNLFETSEPIATGDRTLSFSEKQDAIWVRVRVGTSGKSGYNFQTPTPVTLIIDGVTIKAQQHELLEIEAKEITADVGGSQKAWFQIIGLKNK